jgi:chromate transporter
VVLRASVLGWLLGQWRPGLNGAESAKADDGPPPLISDDALHNERPSGRPASLILVIGCTLWALPVLVAVVPWTKGSSSPARRS